LHNAIAEWQNDRMTEWQNGRMVEWQNGRMAEWQNGKMAECTYMAVSQNGRILKKKLKIKKLFGCYWVYFCDV
jgi:hypothetical protein